MLKALFIAFTAFLLFSCNPRLANGLRRNDLHKDVDPGGTVRIVFPATITGVFEAELEDRKLQIVEFTVE